MEFLYVTIIILVFLVMFCEYQAAKQQQGNNYNAHSNDC